jgi:iron complex outermembrane recepter protein
LTRNEYIHDFDTHTVDVDFQHHLHWFDAQTIVWGTEFRRSASRIGTSDVMQYVPADSARKMFSGFLQDEVALRPGLALTVGTKLEYHDVVGGAIEPNVRAMWTPHAHHSVWAALSRGERTPSLADQLATISYLVVPPSAATRNLPVLVNVVGVPDQLAMENVLALEIGYRVQPFSTLAFDVTAFRNRYDDLSSYARGAAAVSLAGGVPHLVLSSYHQNMAAGTTHGVEAVGTWTPDSRWSVSASATRLDASLYIKDPTIEAGNSIQNLLMHPRTQFTVRPSLQLTHALDLDGTLLYVGAWQTPGVDSYARADVRAGWKITPFTSFDLGVQNLLDDRHVETMLYLYETPTPISRSAFARLSWHF